MMHEHELHKLVSGQERSNYTKPKIQCIKPCKLDKLVKYLRYGNFTSI